MLVKLLSAIFGVSLMATVLYVGMISDSDPPPPVEEQNPLICGWSDHAIESVANFVGTNQVAPEDCIAHPIEFKIMIYTGAVFCMMSFSVFFLLIFYMVAVNCRERIDRLDPAVITFITIVNPFID